MRTALCLAFLLSASPCDIAFSDNWTSADQDQTGYDVTAVDDVVVRGAPSDRTISAYVRAIGGAPMGRLSPRWRNRICVRLIEMDMEHAAFLRNRIEEVARHLGLSPDTSPTCRPDISVYASNDPSGLASTLIEHAPRSFRPARHSIGLGDAALEAFKASDAPVRWWQVSLPVMVDNGQPAIAIGAGAGNGQDPMARSVTVHNGSRLRGNVRDDLISVTIIIDVQKIADVPFEAVSDYIAFVALAPVDPRVPTDTFDTVLNLFDAQGVEGLTITDEDYLFALYASSRAPATASIQAAEIAGRMIMDRRRRESPAPEGGIETK